MLIFKIKLRFIVDLSYGFVHQMKPYIYRTNGSLDKKRISLHMELNDVKADTDKDYDPYKHRKVDHPTT